MSPGFKIFQTKPQANVGEIVLQNGQSRQFKMSNPWPEVVIIRRNNKLYVAFYETGITLIITVYERPHLQDYNVNFDVRVPRIFQQKTRGFLGNFDADTTNEFYTRSRSGTIYTLQPETVNNRLSDSQIFNILQSCKFLFSII